MRFVRLWRRSTRHFFGLGILLWMQLATSVQAAEYQGKTIDGRRFAAKAYSYETGGTYDIQVQFKQNRATMYFASGSQTTIRLNHQSITNLGAIEGYSPGPFSVGTGQVTFSLGIADSQFDTLQPPQPAPLEGFWRISLQRAELN